MCLGTISVFQVPIQKREEVEKEVVIAKDKTASNFKVVTHIINIYSIQFESSLMLRWSEEQISPMNRASP